MANDVAAAAAAEFRDGGGGGGCGDPYSRSPAISGSAEQHTYVCTYDATCVCQHLFRNRSEASFRLIGAYKHAQLNLIFMRTSPTIPPAGIAHYIQHSVLANIMQEATAAAARIAARFGRP